MYLWCYMLCHICIIWLVFVDHMLNLWYVSSYFQVANMIRFLVDRYNKPVPAILEIPSKDHPYDPTQDSVLSRVRYLFSAESVASGRYWKAVRSTQNLVSFLPFKCMYMCIYECGAIPVGKNYQLFSFLVNIVGFCVNFCGLVVSSLNVFCVFPFSLFFLFIFFILSC